MGRYLSLLILAIAAVLSTSIVPRALDFMVALLGNLTPVLENTRGQINLVMLVVLAWSIRAELSSAFVWAFVGGVLIDLYSILPLGTTSAALMIIVYLANGFARQIYRIRVVTVVTMAALATVFMYSYTLIAVMLSGNNYDILMQIRLVLIPTILYNLAAAVPVYALVRVLQRRVWAGGSTGARPLTRAAQAGSAR